VSRGLPFVYALYAWGVAAWAAVFGALTCEDGCGPGPAWKLSHHSAEWGYYWKLGLAFALIATFTALATRLVFPLALVGLALGALVAVVLWWRVDLASSNSAGDLWVWLAAGQVFGVVAVLAGRRGRPTGLSSWRGRLVTFAAVAFPFAGAVAVVAVERDTPPRLSVEQVATQAATHVVPVSTTPRGMTVDLLDFPDAPAGFRLVGIGGVEFGRRAGASFVFKRGSGRVAYTLLAGTDGLSVRPTRTEHIPVDGASRELAWVGDRLVTFKRGGRSVVIAATPGLADVMRKLAASL
jgi:hypothetical protein